MYRCIVYVHMYIYIYIYIHIHLLLVLARVGDAGGLDAAGVRESS